MNSRKMAGGGSGSTSFTGYLVGKVQLDGAIQSEVLTSLVATLFQRYTTTATTANSTDPGKKCLKFNDNIKYTVDCSERGLKLTSPGVKPKDEGFESDCDSIRSVPLLNHASSSSPSAINSSGSSETDLTDLMSHLSVTGKGSSTELIKETESGNSIANGNHLLSLSSQTSPGNSIDNTSISSSQNIQISDDNNSSSGNGSDSDEFCNAITTTSSTNNSTEEINHHRTSPYWEILPNLSSFQSYPIEDVVFCHCDIVHPNVLVWVVRHLAKMIALVTAFRTKAETEQLFQKYRELRVSVKPIKNHQNNNSSNTSNSNNNSLRLHSTFGSKLSIVPPPAQNVPITLCPAQQPPIPAESELVPYTSLPSHVMPTEILYESKSKSPLFFSPRESKLQDFKFDDGGTRTGKSMNNTANSTYSKMSKFISPWSSSSSSVLHSTPQSLSSSSPIIFPHHQQQQQHHFVAHSATKRFDGSPSSLSRIENNANESEEDSDSDDVESQQESFKTILPLRPLRKTGEATSTPTLSILSTKQTTMPKKPVVLVPLKTETVSSPRPIYPKESYLYHVMGRTSSTFAPYQRSINFLPQYAHLNANNHNGSTEYFAWANDRQAQVLVPFSSWMEIADKNKLPHAINDSTNVNSRKMCYTVAKARPSSSRNSSSSRTSALAHLSSNGKGTAKILLRDSAGNHHGMWATLSQRFKRNIRESLMQKFNGVWTTQNGESTLGVGGRGKKKGHKKVTFNAWATVQMV